MDYQRSRWDGWNGNECVYKKEYNKAIEFYTTAIQWYPLEYRYFVNRSFCYDRLKQFDLALEDAQKALSLRDQWGKCYYRKARALKGLKRIKEAEICFLKVIDLEGEDCLEAHNEIEDLRQMAKQLDTIITPIESGDSPTQTAEDMSSVGKANRDVKFGDKPRHKGKKANNNCMKSVKQKANNSLSKTTNTAQNSDTNGGSDTEQQMPVDSSRRERNILKELSDFLINSSLESHKVVNLSFEGLDAKNKRSDCKSGLISNNLFGVSEPSSVDSEPKLRPNRKNARNGMDQIVEIWDDTETNYCPSAVRQPITRLRTFEPTNLWKFRGLYVANVRRREQTIDVLRKLAAEFGKVGLVSLVPQTNTAIINFDNPESPRMAIAKLQGLYMPEICLPNQRLRLSFRPLNDSQNYPSISTASNRQMNNECYFWRTTGCNKSCKLKHIVVNRGIDYQPWMQSKGRYRHRDDRPRLQL